MTDDNETYFSCTDKDGTTIICTVNDWNHIINESGHSEITEGLLKAVIPHPDAVYKDRVKPLRRRILYKEAVLPPPWGSCFIRVVIEYSLNPLMRKAYLCTAHGSYDFPKYGEELIWTK